VSPHDHTELFLRIWSMAVGKGDADGGPPKYFWHLLRVFCIYQQTNHFLQTSLQALRI